jgi:hypothetical protein
VVKKNKIIIVHNRQGEIDRKGWLEKMGQCFATDRRRNNKLIKKKEKQEFMTPPLIISKGVRGNGQVQGVECMLKLHLTTFTL